VASIALRAWILRPETTGEGQGHAPPRCANLGTERTTDPPSAVSAWTSPGLLDPVALDSVHYSVELDNAWARTLRVRYASCEGSGLLGGLLVLSLRAAHTQPEVNFQPSAVIRSSH